MKFKYKEECKVSDPFYGDNLTVDVLDYHISALSEVTRYLVRDNDRGVTFWVNESELNKV